MKGIVFNVLEDMVIEKCGMQAWNDVLAAHPNASGIYTSGESYPDEELFGLVETISAALGKPMPEVIQAFGEYMFAQLARRYPIFLEQSDNLRDFLLSVESVIHIEVRKLYESPNLPTIEYNNDGADFLVMHYHSPRKLCVLAEGLIRGAATHYKTPITMEHPVCMHKGADHCDLVVRFSNE